MASGLQKAIRVFVFLLLAVCMTCALASVYGFSDEEHSTSVFGSFYSLPSDAVDVALIGSSVTQSAWIPSEAYASEGIASCSLATGAQPFQATMNLIKECEKTQHPKVFLIDIRMLTRGNDIDDSRIRRVISNMKMSTNWLDTVQVLVSTLRARNPGEVQDILSYYFDFLVFHSRRDIASSDFGHDPESFLGYYIKSDRIVLDGDALESRRKAEPIPIDEISQESLDQLLDFLSSRQIKAVFVNFPSDLAIEEYAQINYVRDVVTSRGYDYLDLWEHMGSMGIDCSEDFQDTFHFNVWGAQKATRFIAHLLKTDYGLKDHRGDPKYTIYVETDRQLKKALTELEAANN